jgi:hypothetical protein
MNSHAKWLRQTADEIRAEGHNGWGNTCEQAADEIKRLQAEIEVLTEVLHQEGIEVDLAALQTKNSDYTSNGDQQIEGASVIFPTIDRSPFKLGDTVIGTDGNEYKCIAVCEDGVVTSLDDETGKDTQGEIRQCSDCDTWILAGQACPFCAQRTQMENVSECPHGMSQDRGEECSKCDNYG